MDQSRLGPAALLQCACLLLSLLLCSYLAFSSITERSEFDSERLYWEYSGRILGSSWTPGYSEWVQFRTGPLPAPSGEATRSQALPPYTGFVAEYPPGALLYFTALRKLFDDYEGFAAAHNILMSSAFLLSMGIALITLRDRLISMPRRRALIYTCLAAVSCPVIVYLIGGFIVSRFDALTAALSVAAVLLAQRRYPVFAGLLLGLAGAVKLWPLFLLPFLSGTRRDYLLLGISTVTTFAACHAAFLAFGTLAGDLLGYLSYAFDRPIHSESFLALGHYLTAGPTDLVFSFGSWGLPGSEDSPVPGLMQYAYLAVMSGFAVLRLFNRPTVFADASRAKPADLRRQSMLQLGSIALLLILSKAFSGEYMIWLVPLAIAAAGYAWGLPVVMALVAMAGVKLGYIFSEDAKYISPAEVAVFSLKWAALTGMVICALAAAFMDRIPQRRQ